MQGVIKNKKGDSIINIEILKSTGDNIVLLYDLDHYDIIPNVYYEINRIIFYGLDKIIDKKSCFFFEIPIFLKRTRMLTNIDIYYIYMMREGVPELNFMDVRYLFCFFCSNIDLKILYEENIYKANIINLMPNYLKFVNSDKLSVERHKAGAILFNILYWNDVAGRIKNIVKLPNNIVVCFKNFIYSINNSNNRLRINFDDDIFLNMYESMKYKNKYYEYDEDYLVYIGIDDSNSKLDIYTLFDKENKVHPSPYNLELRLEDYHIEKITKDMYSTLYPLYSFRVILLNDFIVFDHVFSNYKDYGIKVFFWGAIHIDNFRAFFSII